MFDIITAIMFKYLHHLQFLYKLPPQRVQFEDLNPIIYPFQSIHSYFHP